MKRRFDSKGVIAIIAAIALPVVLLLASGSMDMGRAYIVKQRLQTAVDAAALVAQVNATNATPETACQSTDAMNAALLANITSNGFLSTSTPTLISCNYDSTAKKIVVTANINLNKTLGFAPSTVTATGYASLDDQGTSPWMYQFKTQNSECQNSEYFKPNNQALTLDTLIMSGPVQNNCSASTNWESTTEITRTNGTTIANALAAIGTVVMNGTQGAQLTDGSYYLHINGVDNAVANGRNIGSNSAIYIDGNVTDNIPIYATRGLTLTSGSTFASTLSSPEILHVIGGTITGSSTTPATIGNLAINTGNRGIDISGHVLNIESGSSITSSTEYFLPVIYVEQPATLNLSGASSLSGLIQSSNGSVSQLTFNVSDNSVFQGTLTIASGSTINLSNHSTMTLYNEGSSLSGITMTVHQSTLNYNSGCSWCNLSNSTITLDQSTMISGEQTNTTAILKNGSKMSFLSGGIPATGTYTLSGGSSLDISQLASWSNSMTVVLGDSSQIIANGTTYVGPGMTGQSYTFQCSGATTCKRQ